MSHLMSLDECDLAIDGASNNVGSANPRSPQSQQKFVGGGGGGNANNGALLNQMSQHERSDNDSLQLMAQANGF